MPLVIGPSSSILEALESAVHEVPGREALVDRDERLTYAQLWVRVTHLARRLADAGVRPGDRVAVSLPNENAAVVAFLSVVSMGAIWVGLNPRVPVPERQKLVDMAAPVALVSRGQFGEGLTLPWNMQAVLDVDEVDGEDQPMTLAGPRPTADAPAVIGFTSGTTGMPRGIVHSHRNLLLPGYYRASTHHLGENPRLGVCLPLSIANVMTLAAVFTVQARTPLVVLDTRRASEIGQLIAAEAITTISIPPAIVLDLVKDPSVTAEQLATLERPTTGGTGCSDELKAAFRTKFGVDIARSYGLTELPTLASLEVWDEQAPVGSAGRLLPYLDIVTVDADGNRLPRGEVGELLLSAALEGEWAGLYRPMLGEWEHGAVSPVPDAPLATGDIGYIDGDDNVFVVDRKKSIINRGGSNVSPAEVEQVLLRHPAVTHCVVLGAPDDRLGERVVALVAGPTDGVLEPTELFEISRARLAGYKVPSEILVVDALPLNAMEKVDRKAARAILDQILGSRSVP